MIGEIERMGMEGTWSFCVHCGRNEERKKSKIFCRTQVTVIGNGVLLFLVAKIIEAQVQYRKKI